MSSNRTPPIKTDEALRFCHSQYFPCNDSLKASTVSSARHSATRANLLNPPAPNGQQRPALLITCADAGLLAERISLNRPDGFHCATGLGTFIPPACTTDGNDSDSIVATIEYAVRVLRVSDIVVCGHSPCGAMATLMHGSLAGISRPYLAGWFERVAPIPDLVRSRYAHLTGDAERQHAAELESVLLSLENLPTYPCVEEGLTRGALHLHGWFFKTATGELFAYDLATGQFEPLMAGDSIV